MTFRWEDPPPVRAVQAKRLADLPKWVKLLRPLHRRPGQWGRVAEMGNAGSAGAIATNLRRGGKIKGVDPALYEFTARDKFVYARYLPPVEATQVPASEAAIGAAVEQENRDNANSPSETYQGHMETREEVREARSGW